jgi:hypothetical protein
VSFLMCYFVVGAILGFIALCESSSDACVARMDLTDEQKHINFILRKYCLISYPIVLFAFVLFWLPILVTGYLNKR